MVSLNEWITSSGKYPERAKSFELTADVIRNAKVLLQRVNALLDYLGQHDRQVSSGFRTLAANSALPNSAKKSAHCVGMAIDLYDKDGSLKIMITRQLLEQFDLYREDSKASPTWVHLQTRPTVSGRRIFMP